MDIKTPLGPQIPGSWNRRKMPTRIGIWQDKLQSRMPLLVTENLDQPGQLAIFIVQIVFVFLDRHGKIIG